MGTDSMPQPPSDKGHKGVGKYKAVGSRQGKGKSKDKGFSKGENKDEHGDTNELLSHRMSYYLRHFHGAPKAAVTDNGFVPMPTLLQWLRHDKYVPEEVLVSAAVVERVVNSSDRFTMEMIHGQYCVRANSGHTYK